MKVSGLFNLINLNEEYLAHLTEIRFSSTFPHAIPNKYHMSSEPFLQQSHIQPRPNSFLSALHIFMCVFLTLPAHTAHLFLSWLPWHIAPVPMLIYFHLTPYYVWKHCMFLSLLYCNNSYQHRMFVSISSSSPIHQHRDS